MGGTARPRADRAVAAWAGILALAAAGCGGDGVIELPAPPVPPPPEGPTLGELQQEVFTPRCALPGCHGSPAPVLGLDLSEGASHRSLVGVPSVQCPGFLRVEPGNALGSCLYMKLLGDPRILGERMPLLPPPLEASELERIRLWIEAGAPDN